MEKELKPTKRTKTEKKHKNAETNKGEQKGTKKERPHENGVTTKTNEETETHTRT